MILEQFLTHTATLDWSTAEDIGTYLDALGLWPTGTPLAVKVREVDECLRTEDATGWPLVGRMKRDSGPWLYKQEASFTPADYNVVIQYWETESAHGTREAVQARDALVQQEGTHLAFPWEDAPAP